MCLHFIIIIIAEKEWGKFNPVSIQDIPIILLFKTNKLNAANDNLTLSLFICSFKFGRKINYVSYLSELEDVLKCEQLVIPARVKE